MLKKYDVITALDICVDFILDCGDVVPEFGQKEKLIRGYSIELGGSACIFACQAAKLGLKTAGIGVAGDDFFGSIVLDKLKASKVLLDGIKLESDVSTGVGVALCLDGGDRAILTFNGTIDADIHELYTDNFVNNSRHIHIASYYLMKRLQPHYPEILKRAKAAGVTVSLDTNWDPSETWEGGILDILPYVDIFLPNENEALSITKTKSIDKALSVLTDKVPLVVLKKGKHGASAYKGEKSFHAESLCVNVADTVGAGDSFDAGFIYGFLSGLDINSSLSIGCICGSLSTERPGGIAGQPYLKDVIEMANLISISK